MRRSSIALIAGIALLALGQVMASGPLRSARMELEPQGAGGFTAVTPGEFAGTLLLGGFRGLACDLLWMRADSAEAQGRYYESQALYDTISRIQPRFEQVWIYLSWDMAYNIGHGVEDDASKWSWMQAGLEANAAGCLRNPYSEKVLRHLAWMFNHRGDLFNDHIRARDWQPLLGPVLKQVDDLVDPQQRLPPFPSGGQLSNFRIAAVIFQRCVQLSELRHQQVFPFAPRAVPLAVESDGDLERNRGDHLRALHIWIEALADWQEVIPRYLHASSDPGEEARLVFGLDSCQRNESRLRRKAAEMSRLLAPDPATGETVAQDILHRRFGDALRLIDAGHWSTSARFGRIQWLDEK